AQAEVLPFSLAPTDNIQPIFVALQRKNNVLGPGSVGSTVKDVQSMLALMGYYSGAVDGNYNQSTVDAVRQFQAEVGLAVDGVVGAATWQKLLPNLATLIEPTPAETTETELSVTVSVGSELSSDEDSISAVDSTAIATAGNLPTLQIEDSGLTVEKLQARLAELNFYSGPLDGIFGVQTEEAVEGFQRQSGLTADGVVGPATWQRLLQ
ncbi:MAG: peptidoglycan-binding protein, partial [Cyanobacteria bacterium P01_D01_bin.56]